MGRQTYKDVNSTQIDLQIFLEISIKTLAEYFFLEMDKFPLKFIWKCNKIFNNNVLGQLDSHMKQ